MIAVGILAILALGISQFISGSFRSSVKVRDSSQCANYAQSVIDSISGFGIRDNVLPPYLGGVGQSATFYAGGQFNDFAAKMPEAARSGFWGNPSSANWFAVLSTTGNISNSHLILGSVTYLESLYNTDPAGYCVGTTLPDELIAQVGQLKNAQSTILIRPEPIDNATVVAGACTLPQRSAPRGDPARKSPSFLGDTNIRYRVQVKVQYQDPNGVQGSCQAESVFVHALDMVNNSAPTISSVTNFGGTYRANPIPTVCDANGMEFEIQFNNLEAGSVPVCMAEAIIPDIDGAWVPCTEVRFPGEPTAPIVSSPSVGVMRIRFLDLIPERQYRLSVGAIDTAGNLPTSTISQDFLVDTVRPTITGISGDPAILTGSSPFVGENYNCFGGPLDFTGTYGGDPLDINWTACDASFNPAVTQVGPSYLAGVCEVTGTPPSGNTLYTLTMTAADECGPSNDPETYQWWYLPNPMTMQITGADGALASGYAVTLAANVGPSGFVYATCDADSPVGAATGNFNCRISGNDQGSCTGTVIQYTTMDVCGNPGTISGFWNANNACYPMAPGLCPNRDVGTDFFATPANRCQRVPGYYEEGVNCGNNCQVNNYPLPPSQCREHNPYTCCDHCFQLCGAGEFYNDPVCQNGGAARICQFNQTCQGVSAPPGGGPCTACIDVCAAGEYVQADCFGQCGANQTCRSGSTAGCFYCKTNCTPPANRWDDETQPNCGGSCGPRSTCASTGGGCSACQCPAGEYLSGTCGGGCGPSEDCLPVGGSECNSCECEAGTTRGGCSPACGGSDICVDQGSDCWSCEAAPPPACKPAGTTLIVADCGAACPYTCAQADADCSAMADDPGQCCSGTAHTVESPDTPDACGAGKPSRQSECICD